MTINQRLRKLITNYEDPESWISRWRARRIGPLKQMIESTFNAKSKVRIVDLGGSTAYWNIVGSDFLKANNARVTIINLPSATSQTNSDVFEHFTGDACDLPDFNDNQFDIVHSNSVIEHVGSWQRMKSFARECHRLAPNHFVQTPYFWFPIEPHYVRICHHWLPWPIRARLHLDDHDGSESTRSTRMDSAMKRLAAEPILLDIRSFESLFPHSTIHREKAGFLVKSMIAVLWN